MGENIEAKNQPKEAAKNKIVRQEDDPLNLAIRAHQNCELYHLALGCLKEAGHRGRCEAKMKQVS